MSLTKKGLSYSELFAIDFACVLAWRRAVLWRGCRTGCFRRVEIFWSTECERDCWFDRDAVAIRHQHRGLSDRATVAGDCDTQTQFFRSRQFYCGVHLPGHDYAGNWRGSLAHCCANAGIARRYGTAYRSDRG